MFDDILNTKKKTIKIYRDMMPGDIAEVYIRSGGIPDTSSGKIITVYRFRLKVLDITGDDVIVEGTNVDNKVPKWTIKKFIRDGTIYQNPDFDLSEVLLGPEVPIITASNSGGRKCIEVNFF